MTEMKGIREVVGKDHTTAVPVEQDENHIKLKSVLLDDIKRSAYVYRG